MPAQLPVSRIISRSNMVRWRRRWASSSLPCESKQRQRSSSSSSIAPKASRILAWLVMYWPAGNSRSNSSRSPRISPVRGSNSRIRSTSSPKNSRRVATSS